MKKKNKIKNEVNNKRGLKILLIAVASIIGLLILSIVCLFIYIISTTKFDKEEFEFRTTSPSTEIITYEEMPTYLVNAILSYEKKSDKAAIINTNSVEMNLADGYVYYYKSRFIEVLKELYISKVLLKEYTKEELITILVNSSYFGNSIYGISNASKYYYDKSVSELTLSESAMLVGMIDSPNRYNPNKNPNEALQRRNYILELMYKNNYINNLELKEAINTPLETVINKLILGFEYADITLTKEDSLYGEGITLIENINKEYLVAAALYNAKESKDTDKYTEDTGSKIIHVNDVMNQLNKYNINDYDFTDYKIYQYPTFLYYNDKNYFYKITDCKKEKYISGYTYKIESDFENEEYHVYRSIGYALTESSSLYLDKQYKNRITLESEINKYNYDKFNKYKLTIKKNINGYYLYSIEKMEDTN